MSIASVVPGFPPSHRSSPPLPPIMARKTHYASQCTHHAVLLPMFSLHVQLYLARSVVCSRLQWCEIQWRGASSAYQVTQVAHNGFGLHIPDDEIANQSDWGPIDGEPEDAPDETEPVAEQRQSIVPPSDHSEAEEIDVVIPQTNRAAIEESQITSLAAQIPAIHPSEIPTISALRAAMTTMTQTHTLGHTLPDPSGNPPAPPGGGSSNREPEGGGGSGNGGGGSGNGGGGGGLPQFGAFIAPPQGGHHDNKFKGNPPMLFNGNRELVRPFLTQWEIYKGLNFNTDTI
ncbi:hypothetical protein EDB83DRAFT_2513701 [Lactarius deliciosus]|nr:hypothetical protein EDB83DRAFT_2513701 [Lactarius deliciosus]